MEMWWCPDYLFPDQWQKAGEELFRVAVKKKREKRLRKRVGCKHEGVAGNRR